MIRICDVDVTIWPKSAELPRICECKNDKGFATDLCCKNILNFELVDRVWWCYIRLL